MRAGLPHEPAELLALVAALVLLAFAPQASRVKDRTFVIVAAIAAAALSALYVVFYLRGGPRIIDATTYFLEARSLAEGHFGFPLREPAAATMGRFLVRAGGDADHAAGIFPPGYPAVLALGFLVRAPLAVGPILAALLVIATWVLARRVAPDEPEVARIAAAASVVCAALRYHTADTMSHGLAALCFTGALASSLAILDAPDRAWREALIAGAFSGWLASTRPVTALALAVAVIFAVAVARRRPSNLKALTKVVGWAALGAIPGALLLLVQQHAATGAWLVSSQRLYYELSDGPPGCFAYGFGANVGCVSEHGDFVRAHLENGYGSVEALGTTLRRLRLHLVDVGNAEPLFAFVLAGAWLGRRDARARLLTIAIAVEMLAYLPFYFDGNYPGGGARFFADILPLEHVLFALAAVFLARKARSEVTRARAVALPLALALVGFAFRGGFEHAALRDREGGRPMFERGELESRGIDRGLVFVNTDHGFDLAFDPDADSHDGIFAARSRGDAIDLFAWASRGRPPAFTYDYDIATGAVRIAPWKPLVEMNDALRIEGASLWPPIAQHEARAAIEFASGACAASGRILAIRPAGHSPSVSIELPREVAGRTLGPTLALIGHPRGSISLVVDDQLAHRWAVPLGAPSLACAPLDPVNTPPEARKIHLIVDLEMYENTNLFGIVAVDIATSKYIDPLPSKVRDSQGIH